jgi:hypothetical protein
MFHRRLSRPLAIGATVVVIAGGAFGVIGAASNNGSAGASIGQTAPAGFTAKAAASTNARSGPAAGGVEGTVSSVSASSFTVSTTGGTKVTIKKTSSITYRKGTKSASASAVKKGSTVLVLGTANGTAMTATKVTVDPVTVEPTGFTPSKTIAFKQGAQEASQKDGAIPTNYTEGSGTIVSGTTANKATTAALSAYSGGVVDRVVKLSNGEYEVHNIGVNWPHHIFVSASFKVVGAD